MMDAYYHSVSSAKMFGGEAENYYSVHAWFDRSKDSEADFRHRALSHHAEGIAEAIALFGPWIVNSQGVKVPVRRIGEQHIIEDLGRIPRLSDWFALIKPERWMSPPRENSRTKWTSRVCRIPRVVSKDLCVTACPLCLGTL